MKINKVHSIVKNILEDEIKTRSDDMYLYYIFCTKYMNISTDNFYKIFQDNKFRNIKGISVFETVSRARRKIQSLYEELKPPKDVQEARIDKEAEYIDYAIGGYNPTLKNCLDYLD